MPLKPINLKSDLSKFYGHNIRVYGNLELISRPRDDRPRTVLLVNIHIEGVFVTDHMWVPYSNKWEDFSHTQKTKIYIRYKGNQNPTRPTY